MNKSINTKKMTQKEFDDYMVMDLIPDVSEDEDSELVIVLTKKGKFKFAKECESCHDFILLEKEYDLPKVVVDSTQTEEKTQILINQQMLPMRKPDRKSCRKLLLWDLNHLKIQKL